MTGLQKWVQPGIVLTLWGISTVNAIRDAFRPSSRLPMAGFLIVAMFWVLVVFALRRDSGDLADAVTDLGDRIVVRKGRIEEHIAICDIAGAEFKGKTRAWLVLLLRRETTLGRKIEFIPPAGKANELVEDFNRRCRG